MNRETLKCACHGDLGLAYLFPHQMIIEKLKSGHVHYQVFRWMERLEVRHTSGGGHLIVANLTGIPPESHNESIANPA